MIVAAAPPPSQILNGNGNQKLESLEEKWNVRIWIQFGRPECLCWQFRWRSKASAVGLVDAFNWHCRIVNSGEFDIQYLSFFKIQAVACYLFGAKIVLILKQLSLFCFLIGCWLICLRFPAIWLADKSQASVFWREFSAKSWNRQIERNPRNQFKISMIVSYAAFRVVVI